MNTIALFSLAYLIGSIPTAYLAGKCCGIDIRQHGSGNVGATNVFRVLGKRWGTFVLAIDITKGFTVVFAMAPQWHNAGSELPTTILQLTAGLSAIAGHTWPIWLKFRGGKGVATSCGVFLAIYPKAVLLALLVWIICARVSRYVSLSSLLAALVFPAALFFFYRLEPNFKVGLGISLALLCFIVYTHRANIKRLLGGTEHKIGGNPRP